MGQVISYSKKHIRNLLCTDKQAKSPAMSATVLDQAETRE